MKAKIVTTCLILLSMEVYCQSVVQSHEMEVAYYKTSSIVFPASIAGVDRGSRDVLAQKAKGVNNVLQLKAARFGFEETNLTVITRDGFLHHFTIRYSDKPEVFTYQVNPQQAGVPSGLPLIFPEKMTENQMQEYARKIVAVKGPVWKRQRANGMVLALDGIYIKENTIFCHLRVVNDFNIPFQFELVRFFIKDRKKIKRTASQEQQLDPTLLYGNDKYLSGITSTELVYALPKFTFPDAKHLVIEIIEQNGGRHLKLKLSNKMIMNAQFIPEHG